MCGGGHEGDHDAQWRELTEPDPTPSAKGPGARIVERGILFYRRRISPLKGGGSCRFQPTCSAYGLTAVRQFGAIRGGGLALLRIFRCAPWHPGGWDPVPRDYPHLATWLRRMHR